MNVLLINYEFPPLGAGAATATWHIGKELAGKGHEIVVLTSGYKHRKGYEYIGGMTIFRCPAIRRKKNQSNIIEMFSFVLSALIVLPWLIMKHRIKGIITFFSFPCGPLGFWANLIFNVPYIISLRGGDVPGTEKGLDWFHRLLKPLRRLIFRRSTAVVANSPGLKNLAQKADPVDIEIIPNGVDEQFYTPFPVNRNNEKFDILFIGRLSEQKNLKFLIQQAAILVRKEKLRMQIHIAGDGPLKKDLKQYSSEQEIRDEIIWHGWIGKKEIRNLCRQSHCFVNPSFYEGMPNAVLEAMACGLPVIASDVAGNNSVVIDGQNGFLFAIHDQDRFRRLVKLLYSNSKLRRDMGQKSLERAIEKFSWSATANAYMYLFGWSKEMSKVNQ